MKIITISMALCAIASVAFGQGNVNFNSNAGPLVSTNGTILIYPDGASAGSGIGGVGLTASSILAPGAFHYALLMQPYSGSGVTASGSLTTLLSSGWIYSGVMGNNALFPGKIADNANALTTAGDALPLGTPNQFVVVGWTANEGATWADFSALLGTGNLAAGGYVGTSEVGTGFSTDIGSLNLPELIFGGGGTAITSPITLDLVVVPEPATMALAGLGGLSLLVLRRKK